MSDWFDYILWLFVFVCISALIYLEYLRQQLRTDDARRETEYRLDKLLERNTKRQDGE